MHRCTSWNENAISSQNLRPFNGYVSAWERTDISLLIGMFKISSVLYRRCDVQDHILFWFLGTFGHAIKFKCSTNRHSIINLLRYKIFIMWWTTTGLPGHKFSIHKPLCVKCSTCSLFSSARQNDFESVVDPTTTTRLQTYMCVCSMRLLNLLRRRRCDSGLFFD